MISNEAIKATLLRLESANDENRAEEDHFRFDAEELLYKPLYPTVDLHPMLRSFAGEEDALSAEFYQAIQRDPRFKNGFLMVILEFGKMNEQLTAMKQLCHELIAEIDREV